MITRYQKIFPLNFHLRSINSLPNVWSLMIFSKDQLTRFLVQKLQKNHPVLLTLPWPAICTENSWPRVKWPRVLIIKWLNVTCHVLFNREESVLKLPAVQESRTQEIGWLPSRSGSLADCNFSETACPSASKLVRNQALLSGHLWLERWFIVGLGNNCQHFYWYLIFKQVIRLNLVKIK